LRAVRCSLGPALFLFAVSASGCSRSKSERKTSSAVADSAAAFGPRADLATNTALPVVDGPALIEKIRQSGHKGVVVNAWASWCDPCREELPMLARVAPKFAAQGVPIWLVSVDDPESYAAAKGVLNRCTSICPPSPPPHRCKLSN